MFANLRYFLQMFEVRLIIILIKKSRPKAAFDITFQFYTIEV